MHSPGSVLVAGGGPGIDYLTQRFFACEPQSEQIGAVPIWKLASTLRDLRPAADLTIARLDRMWSGLLLDSSYLVVPEWIGTVLSLPDAERKLARRSHSLKADLRVVRRKALVCELTHERADFEAFYDTMYLPFMDKRHGQQAVVRNFFATRRLFRRGGLFLVRKSQQPLAGLAFTRRKQTIKLVAIGTINGEREPIVAGAFALLYLKAIEYAQAQGCFQVEVGGSRPCLNDGPLRYKRKWGVHITEQRGVHHDFLMHWHRCSTPVRTFLAHTPIICRDSGGLTGIAAIANDGSETLAGGKTHKSIWIPGLQRLYLVGPCASISSATVRSRSQVIERLSETQA
ncbi:MAG: hypothetical protein L0H29_05310 [Sinobacteraceae bacterium]|nr:hypothetical protein [Nevskiaceae bacterium]